MPTYTSISGATKQAQTLQQQEQMFRNNIEQGFAYQTSRLGLSISVPTPTFWVKVKVARSTFYTPDHL